MTKKTKTEKAVEALAESVGASTTVVKDTTKNRGEKTQGEQTRGNRFTPSEKYGGESYMDTKTRMKIYCEHHPAAQIRIIEGIIEQAPKNAKFAKLFVEMTGGTDPAETKITGEVEQIIESPLNGLTIEELRSLKALKAEQKENRNAEET